MCYLVIDLVFLLHLRMTLRHAPRSLLIQGMYPPCSASRIPKDGHQVAPSAPTTASDMHKRRAAGLWSTVGPRSVGKPPGLHVATSLWHYPASSCLPLC